MTEFEAELHQATGNDNKMMELEHLRKLARQSRAEENVGLTIKHLFAKLQEPNDKWRKTLKAMLLIRIILEVGNAHLHRELKAKSYMVVSLMEKSKTKQLEDRGQSSLKSRKTRQGGP